MSIFLFSNVSKSKNLDPVIIKNINTKNLVIIDNIIFNCSMDTKLIWSLVNIEENELLFKHNITFKNAENIVKVQGEEFNLFSVVKIINSIKYLKQRRSYLNLHIVINSKYVVDDATILVFETLIYQIINEIGKVYISFPKFDIKHAYSHILRLSLFFHNTDRSEDAVRKENILDGTFCKLFELQSYTTSINDFRGLIKQNNKKEYEDAQTNIYSALKHFDYSNDIKKDKTILNSIYEAIIELIDNAYEHSESDCIFSLKCGHLIDEEKNEKYHMVSFSVIDYSKILVGTKICNIVDRNDHTTNINNEIVFKAFENHHIKFNSEYDFDSFGLVSAFQQKVSSRKETEGAEISGSGLSRCLSVLKDYGFSRCYLLSGKDYLQFVDGYIDYNESGNVGFNLNNSYINEIPDTTVLKRNKIYMPGTLYCLYFIVKKEKV